MTQPARAAEPAENDDSSIDEPVVEQAVEPAAAGKRSKRARRPVSLSGRVLRVAWIILLAIVLGVAGYLVWMLVGTNQVAANNARRVTADYLATCSSGEPTPSDQVPVLGLLSFPGLGEGEWPIMASMTEDDLATGIGWYPQTAGVGEIGNMVLVGYRLTNGAPFADLLELDAGDEVRITTCTHVYSYVIKVAPRDLTVQTGDDWVLDAVPGEPSQQPTGRMITLITSQDLLPSTDRSVGFGVLESSRPR